MRGSHRQSPFHRIECWTGSYFRRAALWEVGTYILIEHHSDVSVCDGLKFQVEYLEGLQVKQDQEEQRKLSEIITATATGTGMGPAPGTWTQTTATMTPEDDANDFEKDTRAAGAGDWLETEDEDGDNDFLDGGDDTNGDNTETDVHGFAPYLAGADAAAEYDIETGRSDRMRPGADPLNNTYVRVVHTNGIHHLAMVTCLCRGEHHIPLDLVACRLLPASLTRIRTLFTTALMDYFRLCNLELKASAYQFYQLIRRLTRPVGNAEIINLYHEFRRTSRFWRWMKKLKWAGYGNNNQDPLQPPPGSLANYCPTCPQPGVNLPEDWKSDQNR